MQNLVIVNLMAYDIHVYGNGPIAGGPVFTYPKSGKIARVLTVELGTIQGPELWYEDVEYSSLEEVPDKKPGVFYIVPLVVALAGRERGDLLSPYKKVHDSDGVIIGCRFLQRPR